ncbi:MAG: hypothetical protein IPJ03_05420 [Ignavibacteriales bacterium]|nr:hypothetical protein [Ignavibacteriales bacterium]
MKKYFSLLLVSSILSFSLYSCTETNDVTNPPQAACDQGCQDENLAYGIVDVFVFIWNQNIAGQPAGGKDLTVAGPQGGSIHITGTTEAADNGINTLHLVFEMTNCKGFKDQYNLTFNGTINIDGTFSSTYIARSYTCAQLSYAGTVGKDVNQEVNGNCPITINETMPTVSGSICGRTFSY